MKSKDKFNHILVKKIKEELHDHEFGSMEENWSEIRKKLTTVTHSVSDLSEIDNPNFKRRIFLISGIAASLILLVGLSVVITTYKHKSRPLNTYITENEIGEKILPDGSRVWMNRFSEIKYPSNFKRRERIVYLTGEAFFEVTTNARRPFKILTPSSEIKVVGTSFNVKAYLEASREFIVVNSGLVGVRKKSGINIEFLTIRAGEAIIINKQDSLMEKKVNDDPNYLAWKSKIFEFKDTPLVDVARTLDDAYGCKVVIQTPELDSVGLNATFNNADLDVVLNAIALTLDLQIIEQNDSILISKPKW